MQERPNIHPLDCLIKNDSLFLLEAMIPFVDKKMKAPLAVYIKITELQQIVLALSSNSYVNYPDLNLNLNFNSPEDILSSLSSWGYGDMAKQIKDIKTALSMVNIMQEMNATPSPNQEDYDSENFDGNYSNSFDNTKAPTDEDNIFFHEDLEAADSRESNFSDNDSTATCQGDPFDNIMEILKEYKGDQHE